MIKVSRALISVSDKTGIPEFASGLASLGIEIVSTGGTAALLREKGLRVVPASELSGFPEILDGRVKTLTPQVHAAILARRDSREHLRQIQELGISPIDLVVINLYPFEATVRNPSVSLAEAVENIDIGGPAMLRSAAKNFTGVAVVTDPADYARVLEALRAGGGQLDVSFTYELARKVFAHTSRYDALISGFLAGRTSDGRPAQKAAGGFPPATLSLAFHRKAELRYGENPHQKAGLYEAPGFMPDGLAQAEVLQGKQLSFNNYLDLDSAWSIVGDFDTPAVAIVKHTNPCCAAVDETVEGAYRKALDADPVSAYGGIVGCNRVVTRAMAEALSGLFLEALVAPDYHPEALSLLESRKNLRILRLPLPRRAEAPVADLRTVSGGFLLQERDRDDRLSRSDLRVVTRRAPGEHEWDAMAFAWKLVRHLKSNAVAFASADRLLSAGSGQTSRVECVRLAIAKSRLPLKGSALASDAFFPFPDGLDVAAEGGAGAVIQPGGSIRDDEVIAAADSHGMAMVFTGRRHFKH